MDGLVDAERYPWHWYMPGAECQPALQGKVLRASEADDDRRQFAAMNAKPAASDREPSWHLASGCPFHA